VCDLIAAWSPDLNLGRLRPSRKVELRLETEMHGVPGTPRLLLRHAGLGVGDARTRRNESGVGQIRIKNTHGEVPFPQGELLKNRQLGLGGLRFFSTSASVIIIIILSTGHS
jgi:hypothetical protein